MGETGGEEEPAGEIHQSGPGFWLTLLDSYAKVQINVMRDFLKTVLYHRNKKKILYSFIGLFFFSFHKIALTRLFTKGKI